MSDEESSVGSEGSDESGSEEEDLKKQTESISKEDLGEDLATLFDISRYMDETRNRISTRLVAEFGGTESSAPLVAPASAPDYSVTSEYESADEKQRAMLLDRAIMLLMNDGGGKV